MLPGPFSDSVGMAISEADAPPFQIRSSAVKGGIG
jgi:hypothetical protein